MNSKQSNVSLQSNVICIEMGDERLSDKEIVSRLGYFELMEYQRINPILWKQTSDNRLTSRQKWEFQGPRGRDNVGRGSLWQRRADLSLMPSLMSPNPFKGIDDVLRPRETTTPFPVPTVSEAALEIVFEPEVFVSEQDEVITAGIDEDLLVVAPPGTGKTHTLLERITYLVTQRFVDNPREQILVLSFTRSAVAELKKRLIAKVRAGGPDDLLYVQIRTFDSLATNLLRQDLSHDSIVSGYDKRIEQFNKLRSEGELPNAEATLSKVRFLLVDEVQDLTNDRARMVLAIAKSVVENNGCSMFLGDPAQAIYDWDGKDSENPLTAEEFLNKLIQGTYCGRVPIQKQYSEYRRFETVAMLDFVRKARTAMGSNGLSPDSSHLDELLGALGERMLLASVPASTEQSSTTAILARTNLEAYWIWSWLKDRNIEAELWRGARGSYWPGWIARLFLGFTGESISLEKTEQRFMKNVAAYVKFTFQQALQFLQNQGLLENGSDFINLSMMADHIQNYLPVLDGVVPKASIIVSTIHRSKGLEFDDVLLLAPSKMNDAEDVRVVYVAATRAKLSLKVLQRERNIIRNGCRKGNGIQTNGFHIKYYPDAPRIGLLVDGFDVIDPISILELTEPLTAQKRLWDECADRTRRMDISDISATVSGVEIGDLASKISDDLTKLRQKRGVHKSTQSDLRIVDLATVSFPDHGSSAYEELGTARMAIVPVVSGITSI